MPADTPDEPLYRRRPWHVAAAAVATLGVPAAVAVGTGSPLHAPATVGSPAERIFHANSDGLLFPIEPTPTCEFLNNFGEWRGARRHQGTDIGAQEGQKVYAVVDGVLYDKDTEDDGSAGLAWRLLGDDGVKYVYFHLSGFAPGLERGDRVARGELIGYVGDTGNATEDGWHLHFEVRVPPDETPVDPAPLLAIPSACRIYGTVTPLHPTATSSSSTTTSVPSGGSATSTS